MNKTLMAAGLAVVLGACNSSKKSDGVDTHLGGNEGGRRGMQLIKEE